MAKRGRGFARWLLTGLFMMIVGICSQAAQENYVFFILGENASETVTVGMAVVIEDSGSYYAMTTVDVLDDSAETYRILNENGDSYDLDFTGKGFPEYGLGMFTFQDQVPPETEIMKLTGALKGQIADLLYLDTEGEVASCKLMLMEAQVGEPKQLTLLGWEFPSGEGGLEVFAFPLAVIDDQGGLVGLLVESGELISFHTDVNAFYGQGGSGEGEKTQEDSGTSGREGRKQRESETETEAETETESKIEDETIEESETDKPGDDDPDDKKEDPNQAGHDKKWIFLLAAAGIVLLGAVIVKNKTGSASNSVTPDPIRPNPITPDPIRPDPITPDPISPDPITPIPCSAKATLTATSGVMQGRTYPIGSQGIRIGREASCGIRFPADVKGISRNHCKLFWNEQGILMIMDCGSSYGTYLTNYGKLQDHLPVPVKNGDMFCLGSEKNTFVIRY